MVRGKDLEWLNLGKLDRLEYLELSYHYEIGDHTIKELSKLKHLTHLDLEENQGITDLSPLSELPHLLFLNIREMKNLEKIFTQSDSLVCLKTTSNLGRVLENSENFFLPSLEEICFDDDKNLSEKTIGMILSFPSLKRISFFDCNIKINWFENIKKSKTLELIQFNVKFLLIFVFSNYCFLFFILILIFEIFLFIIFYFYLF